MGLSQKDQTKHNTLLCLGTQLVKRIESNKRNFFNKIHLIGIEENRKREVVGSFRYLKQNKFR